MCIVFDTSDFHEKGTILKSDTGLFTVIILYLWDNREEIYALEKLYYRNPPLWFRLIAVYYNTVIEVLKKNLKIVYLNVK